LEHDADNASIKAWAVLRTSIDFDDGFRFEFRVACHSRSFVSGPSSSQRGLSNCVSNWQVEDLVAEEAQEAQSKRDFIAKLSVSQKEARETKWWLRLAVEVGAVSRQEVEWELDEAGQLLVMIRSAVLTARQSSSRGAK
jgi:hypothetical protein